MKTAKRDLRRSSHLFGAWFVAGAAVLCAPVESGAINAVPPGAVAAQESAAAAPAGPPVRYSAGIADILKLVDAKVDVEVIKTFIRNSPTAYNPSAEELIRLKSRGVGSEILTAILQRGAELRAQGMQPGPGSAGGAVPQTPAGVVNPYAPAPAYDYGAQAVSPAYTYSYPAVSYVYPSYSYGGYDYGWPYFWPSLAFNFGYYPYYGYCGYRYPYWGSGCGYYNGHYGYWGRGGYCGYGGYYGHGGYPGHGGYYRGGGYRSYPNHPGGRPPSGPGAWGRAPSGQGPRVGPPRSSGGGFRPAGGVARPASFTGSGGGMRSGGGFGGRAISAGGRGGSFGGHAASSGGRGGGFGGRGGGGRR